jgi:hypothetical protein
MIGLVLENLLTSLFNQDYADREMTDFDYYVYNNRNFTAIDVDLDDIISPEECLLHICEKNVDPEVDRFARPYAIYTVLNLYRDYYKSLNQVPQF